jgi:hypothetical protein
MKKVWYNVWYEDHLGCWHSAKSKNLASLEEARECAKHIDLSTQAKEIRIKCITEEVVESYFVKARENALKEELVYLTELRECAENLWNLYSSGPLKDSHKVSYIDLSLVNINNSITEVNKKLKDFNKPAEDIKEKIKEFIAHNVNSPAIF